MDYLSKIYAAPPVHEAGSGTKPHMQEEKASQSSPTAVSSDVIIHLRLLFPVCCLFLTPL